MKLIILLTSVICTCKIPDTIWAGRKNNILDCHDGRESVKARSQVQKPANDAICKF